MVFLEILLTKCSLVYSSILYSCHILNNCHVWSHCVCCNLSIQLSRKVVQNIHLSGGSLLGVSRGGPSVTDIVQSLEVSCVVADIWFHHSYFKVQFLFNTNSKTMAGKRDKHALCTGWKWYACWCECDTWRGFWLMALILVCISCHNKKFYIKRKSW